MEDHTSLINLPRRMDRITIPTQNGCNIQLPESPKLPMEFLSRSWSASAVEVSKALSSMGNNTNNSHHYSNIKSNGSTATTTAAAAAAAAAAASSIPEDVNSSVYNEFEESGGVVVPSSQFSFASSATSQLVLERIMSQSEVSPLTSGRLSHSSGPLNLAESDSPPISPSEEFEDIVKYLRTHNSINPLFSGARASAGTGSVTPAGGAKTVGRWLKDRKEKKKEESRAHNAQVHATISVAAVASAVAAIAAATASSSASSGSKNEQLAKTDMAVASAATLVAAQCVEAAEAMGAERDHLASVVSSAVNVRSHDDITTLTAAAATALRGAATLRARALKDVLNVAAVIPVEKGIGMCVNPNRTYSGEITNGDNLLGACNLELLARGCELLKRTRKGDLHWKIVSVYIHRTGQVMLKMKSRHVAGTITKKKKNVVLDVCKDMPAWPGRHLLDDGDERRYFALKTSSRGIIEFECKNQREHDIWTQGVSKLLSIVAQRKNRI